MDISGGPVGTWTGHLGAKLIELADGVGGRVPLGRVGAPQRTGRQPGCLGEGLSRDTAPENPFPEVGDHVGG